MVPSEGRLVDLEEIAAREVDDMRYTDLSKLFSQPRC